MVQGSNDGGLHQSNGSASGKQQLDSGDISKL